MDERSTQSDLPGPKRTKRAALLMGGVALVAWLPIAVKAYWSEAQVYRSQRRTILRPKALTEPVEDAAFDAPGVGAVCGWYFPSTSGAAVVLVHGSGSDRTSGLVEARALAASGVGALVYDAPGHGESDGAVTWGEADRVALRAALAFVRSRPGVTADRVGLVGFSAGGVIATQVAVKDPGVRALALVGTPTDLRALTHHEYRKWSWLSIGPALLALKVHGAELDFEPPRALVGAFAPRPVLVVSGAADQVVTEGMAKALFGAAGEPKQWLSVDGAGHGQWAEQGGAPYGAALAGFFESALGD